MWFKSSVGVAVGEMVYNGREWSRAVLIVDHLKGPACPRPTRAGCLPHNRYLNLEGTRRTESFSDRPGIG